METDLQPRFGSKRIYSPREVEHLIASGHSVVVYKDTLLKLDNWMKFHPGGDKAMFHMIGRDATDEMNAYHCDETVNTFKRWQIGLIKGPWDNMLSPIQGGKFRLLGHETAEIGLPGEVEVAIIPKIPSGVILSKEKTEYFPISSDQPIRDPKLVIDDYDNTKVAQDLNDVPSMDYETQRAISQRYNELHDKIKKAGLYDCNYIEYFHQFLINLSLILYCAVFFKIKWYFLSACFLGVFWQQLVFIAHDAAHNGITHNYQIDNIIGIIIGNWIGGLSVGWWKRSHNIHHLVTNDPVHDPDIQHLPFFCVSSRLFGDVFSTYYEKYFPFDAFAQVMIPIQHYMYYPILCFGRFNLYKLSWEYLLKGQGPRRGKAAWFRYFELAGLSFFFYWFFYLVVGSIDSTGKKLEYVLVSHIVTMIVHVQITLSHFAMSTSDLGVSESFPSRQLRTTMDISCPKWLDFFHGGLHYQAIHHLFPRLPRHNFRAAQDLVLDFCKETGLKYSVYGFVEGNGVVLSHLEDIGKQASIMKDCLNVMSKSKSI